MDKSVVLSPNLDGVLDGIAQRHAIQVPVLNGQTSGERKEVEREVRDYGEVRSKRFSVLDVTIPFTGDNSVFHIAPSHSHADLCAEVRGHALVLTMEGDDNAKIKSEVSDFKQRVNENLERLRVEVAASAKTLRETISRVASQRREKFRAERDRDGELGFPVS